MTDLEIAKKRLEELADYEETKKISKAAEDAKVAYDLAYYRAIVKLHRDDTMTTNPTLLKAYATTDPLVRELAIAAADAKAIWQARQEAARNARAVLEAERSLNADRRAIV